MILIKKLDAFVLKKFLLIFFGSFFITLFVFMMQFTWRYVDELIGKGLTMDVLGEFFWYMGLTLVPMALPLSILLASLISFGNMAEQLELLAMKASGVSLLRIMRPVMILTIGLATMSFFFQNKTSPEAQLKLRTLLLSMRETSPALEIPEGVFYGNIPNFSLFVERKDVATGMLYNVMIYKTDLGFDKAQIVVSDSARIRTTDDKQHLIFDIWNGEQYENLSQNGPMSVTSAGQSLQLPYERQSFCYKQFIIDFDSNFAKLDEDQLRSMATAKNLMQLSNDIDSMEIAMDSIGKVNFNEAKNRVYKMPVLDKAKLVKIKKAVQQLNFDSLLHKMSSSELEMAQQKALSNIQSYESELEWESAQTEDGDHFIRSHQIEWNKKFTLSLACIFFFFIGAPLSAIIRKGGLGLPTVISVLIFIFYYIIDTSGMKMARDGMWNMTYGMWISSFVLAPIGVYLTYKANNDSVVFNLDIYREIIKRILGIRSPRHLQRKEVIIHTPDYGLMTEKIDEIKSLCEAYRHKKRLYLAPNYIKAFFKSTPDHEVENIATQIEAVVDELSNTRNASIFKLLNNLPIIYVHAHTLPFEVKKWNVICGVIFPVGVVLWIRMWRFSIRLYRDLKQIEKTLTDLYPYLIEEQNRSVEAQ